MTAEPLTSYDTEGVQWAWDATSLTAAWECPRKYQYTILEGWQNPGGSVHLWFGGLYAAALEYYHKLRAEGHDFDTAEAMVVRRTLIDSWTHERDANGERIPGTGGPTLWTDEKKSRETLIRTIIWYLEEYRDDPYSTYITSNGKPAVELSFRIPIEDDIMLCGHLDRLCQDEEENIFVHDQKTTGMTLSPYYYKMFKPSIQFATYTFGGKMLFELPISGVIVDAAQIAVGFSAYGRQPVLFTNDELDEWYEESLEVIRRTQAYARAGKFPRNTTSCDKFGGCPFRDVCSRSPSVRPAYLKGEFDLREERWDPIKPR